MNITKLDNGFRGNLNLKAPNSVEYVSKKVIQNREDEFIKCGLYPTYFTEKYFTILDLDKGKVKLKLYPKQRELVNAIFEQRRVINLASRQSGKTTAYTVFALHTCIFEEDKKILICADSEEKAKEFLDRIKLAYENLPNWLKPGVEIWNKKKIKFSNGCTIVAIATSSNSTRGYSASFLILDELAFVPPNIIDAFWTSVMPIISRSMTSKIIICSTSNGIGNKFHELWCDATISEHSVWTPIRIDWWDVPGRDEAWKKAEIESYGPGGERKFAQEYGNEFLGSSPTLLNAKALNSLIETEKEYRTPYTTKQIGNDKIGNWNIKIYEPPTPNNAYVLGCDVGEGIGSDYSVIRVLNITNLAEIKEVAYFSSNIINGPSFAYLITKLGIRYNYGAVALERNGIGKSTLDFLVNVFEYDNIVDVGNKSDSVGIFSSNSTKVDACIHFRDSLESGLIKLILRDRDSLLELQKFERVKSKSHVSFSASSGHDDTVMALIWGIYVTKLDILEMYYNITGYGKGLFGEEIPIICRPDSNSMIEDTFDTESMYEQKQLDYEKKVDEKLNLMSGSKSINEIVTNNYGLTTVDKKPEEDDDFFFVAGNGVNLTDEEW